MATPPSLPASRADLRELTHKAAWTAGIAWSVAPAATAGLAAVAAVESCLPAAQAVVARELVNVVTRLVGTRGDAGPLVPWFALSLGVALATVLAGAVRQLLQRRLVGELNLHLTTLVLEHARTLEMARYDDPDFQDVRARAQQNTAQHFARFLFNVLDMVTGLAQTATLVAIVVLIEPLILLALSPLVVPYALFRWRVARRRYDMDLARTTRVRWTAYFADKVLGRSSAAEVKLLDLAPLLIAEFRRRMVGLRDEDWARERRAFPGTVAFVALSALAVYATFFRVLLRAVHGALTVGDVAIYAGAAARLRGALEGLIEAAVTSMEELLYVSNLETFLHTPPEAARAAAAAGHGPAPAAGALELAGVRFTYPGAARPSIDSVSFRVEPGEVVALVGPNGAGKSTLIKLIAGLYAPDAGTIRLDGVDAHDLASPERFRRVSVLFQEFNRYEATAADNVAYGDWRALCDDGPAVEAAARSAGAHSAILATPDGYATLLGRLFGRHDLSGGGWQRLALARAFARPAPVLVLDEPTSHQDAESEHDLLEHVRKLCPRRTTLLVSHRLSTVQMADRVLVMDRGRVVEAGTHESLLRIEGGLYRRLYHRQTVAATGSEPR